MHNEETMAEEEFPELANVIETIQTIYRGES